jgi:hypothetical protein
MRGEPGDGSAGVPDLAQLPWRLADAGPVLLVSATRRITFDRARLAFVAFMFAFTYVVGLGVTTGYAVSGAHWVGGQLTSLISATLVSALTFFCAFIAPRPPGTARLLVGLLRLPVRFVRLMGQGARGSAKAGGDAPGRAHRR